MSANRLKLNTEKNEELLWARSLHDPALFRSSSPSLRLGTDNVAASDQVRVLRVTLSLDPSPGKHFSASVQHVSTGFANSNGSDVHSMPIQWLR